jgi:hypothetical protein
MYWEWNAHDMRVSILEKLHRCGYYCLPQPCMPMQNTPMMLPAIKRKVQWLRHKTSHGGALYASSCHHAAWCAFS